MVQRLDSEIVALAGRSQAVRASFWAIEAAAREFAQATPRHAEFASMEVMEREGATVIEVAAARMSQFQVTAQMRAADLLEGIIVGLNRRSLVLAALPTRSFIELAAHVVHSERQLTRRLTRGVGTREELEELEQLFARQLLGTRFDWSRWLSDEHRSELRKAYAEGQSPNPEVLQVNVLTMLNALDRVIAAHHPDQAGSLRLAYDLLSDMVHPSMGARLNLLSYPSKGDGWVALSRSPHADFLRWYCLCTTTPLISTLANITMGGLNAMGELARSLREEQA